MANLDARENFRRKRKDWVASMTRMRLCFRNLNRRTERRIIWMRPIKGREQPPAKQEVWTTAGLVAVEESVHPFSYPETEIHRRRRTSIEKRNRDCTGHGSILLHNFRRLLFRPPRCSTCRPDSTISIFPCIILACFIPPWWWIQIREVTVPMDETIYEISPRQNRWFDTDLFDAWNNLFIHKMKKGTVRGFFHCVYRISYRGTKDFLKLETRVKSEVYITRRVVWFSCIISHVEANKIGLEFRKNIYTVQIIKRENEKSVFLLTSDKIYLKFHLYS